MLLGRSLCSSTSARKKRKAEVAYNGRHITKHQLEIFRYYVRHGGKETASKFGISIDTVHVQMHFINRMTHTDNAIQALNMLLKVGLVTLDQL